MPGQLTNHWHGKARVRVLKRRIEGPKHSVLELTAKITLWGDYDHVYIEGDNRDLVATDTMKNTVYVVAKNTKYESLEQYGLTLTKHFLDKYSILSAVKVELKEHPWVRYEVGGKSHNHGFVRGRNDYHIASIHGKRGQPTAVSSGIRDLVVLKTTQAGFVGFDRDENTALPEVTDRLLSTSIGADWTYITQPSMDTDFNGIFETARSALADEFFGHPVEGIYSKSVQTTLYLMANRVLSSMSNIADIKLDMPNIHFLPAKLLNNHGLEWTGEVHMPTDEPHGTICATVTRAKL